MLSASLDFRRVIAQNTKVLVKGTLTLADGTVRELTGDDLMMGSTSFTDSVSSAGSFDIGSAIIGRLSLSINNYDGRFDDYDFEGAEVVPYVGARLSGGIEWIRKGVYGIEQPETYGNVIGMVALDNMRRLERAYAGVGTTYPATLGTIAQDICTHCGLTLATSDFANCSFVVQERPDDPSLTCIAMIAYVAQASGNWARCDVWGRVRLDWYDTSAFEGGAAGGGVARVSALASLSVATDDVVVTGVRATAQDGGSGQAGESHLFGSEGYVLELPDNPLVQYGTAQAVASQVGARVVGMRFRPFDISALGDPTIEAGDPIVITDGKRRQYRSYLTTLTYKVGGYEAMSCHAESPGRNRAESYTALTRAIVKLRNADREERSAREIAVANLARQLAESSGLYMTAVQQQDGSTIYYMHDKPALAQSQIVWKLTANAFGISTDGGRTYPYGLDVNGDAILNRIYAIGLDADYINSGALTIRDGGNTVFSADADTGIVFFRDRYGNFIDSRSGFRLAASAGMGDRTVQDVIDGVDATITGVDVEYAQNQSRTNPPATGWDTTAPAWREGYYIWSRTATTTAEGTTYSDPVCISGRDGSTGTNAATIYLYQRAATAPARPSATLTYAFSTGELTGSLGSWTRGIPDGADTCWVTVASAISNGDTDTIAPSEWSDPVELAAGGVDGLNQAFIYLHKRAWAWRARGATLAAPDASAISVSGTTATVAGTVGGTTLTISSDVPAPPSGALTYTFATGALSGNLEGWSRGVPDGDAPCWVTTAVAISSEATDLIGASEWAQVVKLVEDGEGSTVESVEYAIGGSGTQAPTTGWGTTVPNVAPGLWLWTRTTYSDGNEAYTCSYMGTDGADGKSVAIRSVTKEGRTTTLVLASTDGTTETLTIVDGEDGDNGAAGASGYVHVAWANSADGTQGFSTHDSAGKTHIGVYTDNTEADSQSPADYSWSKIKGEKGIGVSAVVEQYYLSTSDSTQTGGSWSTDQPEWSEGKYIWTRSVVTWSDGITTQTDPVLAKAVNGANERSDSAMSARSNLIAYNPDPARLTEHAYNERPHPLQAIDYLACEPADGTNGCAYVRPSRSHNTLMFTPYIPLPFKAGDTIRFEGRVGNLTDASASVRLRAWLYTSSHSYVALISSEARTVAPGWSYQTLELEVPADYDLTGTPLCAIGLDGGTSTALLGVTADSRCWVTTAMEMEARLLDESLSQEGVFNRLTNNGETQGIYLEDGKVYLNATYMRTGTLDASLIKAGALVVSRNGATVLSANLETGVVSISGDCITMGSESVTQAVNAVRATYGTCTTSAGTAAKAVTCSNFALRTGAVVTVKFTNKNTAASPTLNVNNTGAKPITLNGSAIPASAYWGAGETVSFIYDGTNWAVTDGAANARITTNATDIASLQLTAQQLSVNLQSANTAIQTNATDISTANGVITSMQATYATCSTAAGTAAKVAKCANFVLRSGAMVTVKFTNKNTAASPTLNVNSTGAKAITLNGSAIPEGAYWAAGETMSFVYNGSDWVATDGATIAQVVTNETDISSLKLSAQQFSVDISNNATALTELKATYATCSTTPSVVAKEATCAGFALRTGAVVAVKFVYANTAASPTLNVNGTGAKAIYLNSSALPEANWWKAGDVVTFVYNGTNWYVADGSTLTQLASTNANVSNLTLRADSFDVSIAGVKATYGTCSTAADVQTKVATISGFAKYVGQTVTIRFTYKNETASPKLTVRNSDGSVTATGYIYVNGSTMSEHYWWKAGETITLVWDGSYWRVGDGGTMSRIKVLQDSIDLTVSNGSLGSTASIKLSVGGNEISKSLDLTGVRNAFKNDTSAITISAGVVTFNSNTIVVNSTNFKVTSNGTITATSANLQGTFECGSTYKIKLESGTMYGYQSNSQVGYINYTASTTDVDTGTTYKGIQVQASGAVRISSPRISVANTSNVSTTATWCKTGTWSQQVVKSIRDNGGGSISWTYGTVSIQFINGLCVSYATI